MSQDRRVKLQCTNCKQVNYNTKKKPQLQNRLELSKYCKRCRNEETGVKGTHTLHKETK